MTPEGQQTIVDQQPEPASPAADTGPTTTPDSEGWQTAKNGRQFVANPGGGWPIWRRGDETVPQARDRAQQGKSDKAPKSRKRREVTDKTPPHVARDEVTRRIETMLADVLTAPAIGCAMFGDQWGANHFTVQGQRLAANVARTSEHNPWLRGKLEQALEGEQNVMAIVTSVSLFAGVVGYAAPPVIRYAGLPVSDRVRTLFGLPLEAIEQPPAAAPAPGAGGTVPLTEQMEQAADLFAAAAAAEATVNAGLEADELAADAEQPPAAGATIAGDATSTD